MKTDVLDLLRSQKSTLYALLDGARRPRVLELLDIASEPAHIPDDRRIAPPPDDPRCCQHESLYILRMKEQMARVGPWIVRLPRECDLLELLVREGWGDAWGWYFCSAEPLAAMRQRFRRFITVEMPDRSRAFFRFYDPRVIAPFLKTCDGGQRAALFKGVDRIVYEGAGPGCPPLVVEA